MNASQFDWIFFDLDGTLWDHRAASSRAIMEVCTRYGLAPMSFLPIFRNCNETMWRELAEGGGDFSAARVRRFEMALAQSACGCSSMDAEEISTFYLEKYLEQPSLIDGAQEAVLAAAKRGRVAILTNGARDTQDRKLADLGAAAAKVEFMICAEDVPALKPSPLFFQEAAARAGHPSPDRVLMVGDSACDDIACPARLGWHTAWIGEEEEKPSDCRPSFFFPSLSHFAKWVSLGGIPEKQGRVSGGT